MSYLESKVLVRVKLGVDRLRNAVASLDLHLVLPCLEVTVVRGGELHSRSIHGQTHGDSINIRELRSDRDSLGWSPCELSLVVEVVH